MAGSKRPSKHTATRPSPAAADPRLEPGQQLSSTASIDSLRRPQLRSAEDKARIASLEMDLERQRRERAHDEAALGEMLVRIAGLEREKREADDRERRANERARQLEADLEAADIARARVSNELTEALRAAEERLALADARAKEAAARLSQDEEHGSNSPSENTQLTERYAQVCEQRDGFERALRTSETERRETNDRLSEVATQRDGFERGLVQSQQRLSALTGEHEDVLAQLREVNERCDHFRQIVRDANERAAHFEKAQQQSIARIEELEAQLAEGKAREAGFDSQRNEEEERRQKGAARVAELEAIETELTSRNVQMTEQLAQLSDELAAVRAKLDEREKEVRTVTDERAAVSDKWAQREGELAQETSRLRDALRTLRDDVHGHERAALEALERVNELSRKEAALASLRTRALDDVRKVLASTPKVSGFSTDRPNPTSGEESNELELILPSELGSDR